jgi:MoaA/NifB/PqqE/SkfB family radical SAM enzyme
MTSAESVHHVSVMKDLSFLWLEITAKCNLSCTHCYAESGPLADLYGTMTYGDWTRVLDEAADLGCRSVQFIGGEPTMHPQLDDLVDHANHRGFEFIEVYTNATRLGRKLLGCFQRNGVRIATSFYSDDPAVHEHITQGKGSWARTVRGIESVLAAGLSIRVGVIETERNQGHGPRAIEFLNTLGVQNARIDRERGVGRGKLHYQGGDGERYEELCGQCWKGKLCVTSSGEVFPCVFARATGLGHVKLGLAGILLTQKLAVFRHKVRAMQESRPTCHPSDHGPGRSALGLPEVVRLGMLSCTPECTPAGRCNPDVNCNPAACNPAAPCNPDACNPAARCNPDACGPISGSR